SAYGVLAGLCCLLTNVAATSLIAYRTWEHRCIIMSYLRRSSRRTQAERTLALLVESGLLYCTLWVSMVLHSGKSDLYLTVGSRRSGSWYATSYMHLRGTKTLCSRTAPLRDERMPRPHHRESRHMSRAGRRGSTSRIPRRW
ncbi:hypothetical protein K466DRAFT_506549, partial [Polyporus arcularius HHB13444]